MDDLPPPPYTSQDPVAAISAPFSESQVSLRGGYTRPIPSSQTLPEAPYPSSAAAYLHGRLSTAPNAGVQLPIIEHTMTITTDTARDDVLPPPAFVTDAARDVSPTDWSTFVNYLFPLLHQSASHKSGNEKGVDPRAFVEEDTPERRQRLKSVASEWNERFFNPRFIYVNIHVEPSTSARSIHATSGPSTASHGYSTNNGRGKMLRRRFSSSSTSSSSSSSSDSSIDSIKSKDLEGAPIDQLRSALHAWSLDPSKTTDLRNSVRRLRTEFRSQRREISHAGSPADRKGLKREHKSQRKEIKQEVKAVVKEVKATRKADHKRRKAERKVGRKCEREGMRGADRIARWQEKAQRKLERAQEREIRVKERRAEAEAKAATTAAATATAHERAGRAPTSWSTPTG